MRSLKLVKLGGSIITDKKRPFTARGRSILRLAREIKNAKRKLKDTSFIVGHGAGSFAHIPALKYKTKSGITGRESIYGMSVTEDAARRLNMIVVNNFLKEKLPAFPFSPASFLIADTQSYSKSYIDPIIRALQIASMPVVYGDVIMDKKIGCTIFSTEKVLSILARRLKKLYKISVVYASDVDGVYDERGKVIPAITGKNFDSVKKSIMGAKGVDVTGGMLHKVNEALILSRKYNISTVIVNGNKVGRLEKTLRGKKTIGTIIK